MRNKLKRCIGVSETVGCTMGHPLVQVSLDQLHDKFQPSVIFGIRNFITAFPSWMTDKNIAYHKADGQNPPEGWTSLRDSYLESTFESWKSMIQYWALLDQEKGYYKLGFLLQYENIMTFDKAVAVRQIHDLSKFLNEVGGYDVTLDTDDMECIWYTTFKEEWTRQQSIMGYVPPYTARQLEWIQQQIEQFLVELEGRKRKPSSPVIIGQLIDILKGYQQQTRSYDTLSS
jgi:hypothetical protein